jgi:hypothetical protein
LREREREREREKKTIPDDNDNVELVIWKFYEILRVHHDAPRDDWLPG